MESIKGQIRILLTVFQIGMTFFLGVGVSLVSYINLRISVQGESMFSGLDFLDVIVVLHIMLMIMSGTIAACSIVRADAFNDNLFDQENRNDGDI